MSESIHTVRWISQIADEGWDLHLFPSVDQGITHSQLRGVDIHHSFYVHHEKIPTVRFHGIPVPTRGMAWKGIGLQRLIDADYRVHQLNRLIKKIQPDIIQSLEFQAGGYLTHKAKMNYSGTFPPWIATNWGSDIYFFRRDKDHERKIRELLEACDYYSSECQRDIVLAEKMGFRGRYLPVIPNGGGYDVRAMRAYSQEGRPSDRRIVIVKGYQGWAGRALVALEAVESCAELLQGYEVVVYSGTSPEVKTKVQNLQEKSGIQISLIPQVSHEELMKLFGRSRIYIGLSISDGISTSLLESMIMGTFPIQSDTACADEWISDGISGFIVPAEDPETIATAIRRALTDDDLVDRASVINERVAGQRLDQSVVKPQVIRMYEEIYAEIGL
jgi:glycosyltransferase involved in cell wall biosynthesis